ncbi:DUF4864 domain-containing protein [Wenxinia marina]|uniref:DUF4864 domain-containing protein n=1 Tax=Wenxinia marina DSM 24838 TaxID=1123501 RepID=A0A0D0Q4G8_9RHOB|nr:DUF4864 domain-containing protein [Wenxinia marina]KIQ67457.1 hypothetical protein Wenmar_03880 [Wenxinia marina DSM 24838]
MRTALTLALCLAAAPLVAQETSERAGIEDVISRQLQAFNDRDVSEAWRHASPMIQRLFGTAENFGTMVETGYPMVWSNSDARFLELDERGAAWLQRVLVKGPEGAMHVVEYEMIRTEDGWKINGARILPAPDVGV